MTSLELLIRPAGEVSLKGPRTRRSFRRTLRANLRDALQRAGLRTTVRIRGSRLQAEVSGDQSEASELQRIAVDAVTRVFGVGSVSLVQASTAPTLDAIVDKGHALWAERVKGRRYAVRCRRAGRHPFRSTDVERALGAALNEGATVDLTNPELVVRVEVNEQRAVLHGERIPGPGGLPVGTGGRALVLVSGGYDSAVAAWSLLKRGVAIDLVHFRLAGRAGERQTLRICKLLTDRYAAGTRPTLWSLPFEAVVRDILASGAQGHAQLLLKRRMLRAADAVADRLEAATANGERQAGDRWRAVDALVTGESLAQVSSQTLANLRAIEAVARRPLLRPLLSFDKIEIIDLAKRIGTADLSAKVREVCGIEPGRPETRAEGARTDELERALSDEVLAAALADAVPYQLRSLSEQDLTLPFLFVDELPEGAQVLECSPGPRLAGWRPPGTVHLPVEAIDERHGELDPERTFVTTCPFGTRSVHAAEMLQRLGFAAYAFRGGTAKLRAHLERQAREATFGREEAAAELSPRSGSPG